MKISTKFGMREKVYVVFRVVHENIPCDICDGTNQITIKNKSFRCPNCRSNGTTNLQEICVLQATVIGMDITMYQKRNRRERYHITLTTRRNGDDHYGMEKDELFRDPAEALKLMSDAINPTGARVRLNGTSVPIDQLTVVYRQSMIPDNAKEFMEDDEF